MATMQPLPRTWQDNADEFAALDQGEGWPFARLVACSVKPDEGNRARSRRDHDTIKVSARQFATKAGTSTDRVMRYYRAWEKVAAKGLVPKAATLMPEDAHRISDPDVAWDATYDASKAGGRPRDSKPENAVEIIEKRGATAVVEKMSPETRWAVAEAMAEVEPETVVAVARVQENKVNEDQRKSIERTVKAHQAREATTPKVLTAMMALDAMWPMTNLIEAVEDGYQLTAEGSKIAHMLADWSRSNAVQWDAWADGSTQEKSDEDFQAEMQALMAGGA